MRFEALRTERLVIRPVEATDVVALHERRNDSAVGEYQSWALPFLRERSEAIVADAMAMDGPVDGSWWMATVCLADGRQIIGDVVVRLGFQGRSAEIGYTFSSTQWGQGYAVEAVTAMVEWLIEIVGVHRVSATTHPENHASHMVLERVGLLFEGHTRGSCWVADVNSDDWLYGMTRQDWEAWRDRPRMAPNEVRLEEIDWLSAREVYKVAPHRSQWRFVAPMERSFADALFPEVVDGAPVVPWMRAVVADGEIVGFVMLALVTEHHPEPYLWRFLIDRRHQRRGLGSRALELIIDECRSMAYTALTTSWVEGRGSPRDFYLARGFAPTGRIIDEETEARLSLG